MVYTTYCIKMCECVRAHVYIRYVNTLIYIYTHTCRIHRTLHTNTCLKACTIPSLVLLACSTVLITSNGCSNVCKRTRTYTHTCTCTCTYTPTHKQTQTCVNFKTHWHTNAQHVLRPKKCACVHTLSLLHVRSLTYRHTLPPTLSVSRANSHTCTLSHTHIHTQRCTHLAGCRCEA